MLAARRSSDEVSASHEHQNGPIRRKHVIPCGLNTAHVMAPSRLSPMNIEQVIQCSEIHSVHQCQQSAAQQ